MRALPFPKTAFCEASSAGVLVTRLAGAFVAMASMQLASLPLRHWHFGRQLESGPDYDNNDQLEDPTLVGAWLTLPEDSDLICWARSCCNVPLYELDSPTGGWSPGRSVLAMLETNDGTREGFYYKLHDGPDLCDVSAHPGCTSFNAAVAHWYPVWDRFLSVCLHFELSLHRMGLVMEVAEREVNFWDDPTCVDLAGGSAEEARGALIRYSSHWRREAFAKRAALLDARVFQHEPELVLTYIAQRRTPWATCTTSMRFVRTL